MQTPLGETALAFEGREDGLVVTVLRGFAVVVAEPVTAERHDPEGGERDEHVLQQAHGFARLLVNPRLNVATPRAMTSAQIAACLGSAA